LKSEDDLHKKLEVNTLRVSLYIRVSTEDQAQEGFSIEAQKRRLLAYSESQDWEVYNIYIDDGYSAKDTNRPAMVEMLKAIEKEEFDIVLVYKLDRLTRSASDCDSLLKLFEQYKVKFQSCTETFETRTATGRLFIRLIAQLAQWERETIAERVRMGMEQKVREGKKPGGKYPYGYDKQGKPIPEEFAVLRRIYDMYMKENLSFKKIATRLYTEGVKRRGYDWTQSTVGLTLENAFYAGILQFGTKTADGKYIQRRKKERVECIEVDGKHEAVWTKQEYYEMLYLMNKRRIGGNSRKREYWFTGLLRCGKCRSSMYGRLTTQRSRKDGSIIRTPYYWCNNRKQNGSCKMPMIRQVHLEHLVFEHIKKVKADHSLIKQTDVDQLEIECTKKIRKLKSKLDEIKKRKKKWQYAFVEDSISVDDLRERMVEEDKKEETILSELNTIQIEKKSNKAIPDKIYELDELWKKLNDDEKKEAIQAIFEEITVFTGLENVKGVKNRFFDAHIEVTYK